MYNDVGNGYVTIEEPIVPDTWLPVPGNYIKYNDYEYIMIY